MVWPKDLFEMKKKKRICKGTHQIGLKSWGMVCWVCDWFIIDDTPEGKKKLNEIKTSNNK